MPNRDLQLTGSLQLGRPSGKEVGDLYRWTLATLEMSCRRVVVFGQVGRVLRNAVAPPCSPFGVGTKPDLVGSEADASLGITRRSPPRTPGVVCDHGTGWSDAAVVLDGAPRWLGIPPKLWLCPNNEDFDR